VDYIVFPTSFRERGSSFRQSKEDSTNTLG